MAYPTDLGVYLGTTSQGTSLLTSPDHSLDHRALGSAAYNLGAKLGIGSGTPTANGVLVGASGGTSAWGTTLATVSVNNSTLGTPRITGGTASAFLLGTSTMQGGTANGVTIGTPVITGGVTLSSNGSITQSGTADHITLTAGGTKWVKQSTPVVTGTAGTTVSYPVGFIQTGWFDIMMANGTSTALGTTTFPQAYGTIISVVPQIVGASLGTPAALSDYTTSVAAIGNTQGFGADSVTTTGFKVSLKAGGNAGANTHYAISWIAYGL